VAERDEWIPLSDGVRLATTLFTPDDEGPWPAILEALPYRKDDVTIGYRNEYRRLRDEGGYAVCRVDLRGTGSSGGLAVDEYPPQEQQDLCEVIAWLAGQSWCTGSVGMYGTSYSGFNSIQVAMERPPALKAIIPIFATDDRFNDDVHYHGGAQRCMDFVDYNSYMVAMAALPPTPAIWGEEWRSEWKRRVDDLVPWVGRWVEEQTYNDYWKHGSLRTGYDRIVCPMMIVAGWADGYRNATFRVMEQVGAPTKILFGPWPHASVETCKPGPNIDLVPEMIRWWDRWLKDEANGIDEEPPITVFVRRSTRPEPDLAEYRGEWRYEPRWPLERGISHVLHLDMAETPGRSRAALDELQVRPDTGYTASISCAGALPWGPPFDQRPDEAFSLVYEWEPLTGELEILGYPTFEVTVRSSAPIAFLSAKLCDVFPDGASALVSRGFLNLTHRDSQEDPEALEPGRDYTVTIKLDVTSWTFEPGHRVRLDLAGTDWPNVWAPPENLALSIARAGSSLTLPVVEGDNELDSRPQLRAPVKVTKGGAQQDSKSFPTTWRKEHDIIARETRVVVDHGSESKLENGARSLEHYWGETGVSTTDSARCWAHGNARYELTWDSTKVTTEVRTKLTSNKDDYVLEIDLEVAEEGGAGWTRNWSRTIPRRLQ